MMVAAVVVEEAAEAVVVVTAENVAVNAGATAEATVATGREVAEVARASEESLAVARALKLPT